MNFKFPAGYQAGLAIDPVARHGNDIFQGPATTGTSIKLSLVEDSEFAFQRQIKPLKLQLNDNTVQMPSVKEALE